MWNPAIRAGTAWYVMSTVIHGLEPEASFDEDGELLVGESIHPRIQDTDEKRSTIQLAREQLKPGFGLRAGDTAEDIFVGKFVCSGSELALDSFKWLFSR